MIYFYPRSPCGERLACPIWNPAGKVISIHALLAESDSITRIRSISSLNFYPRSPCGERLQLPLYCPSRQEFLSTLSLRRATSDPLTVKILSLDFYPRSPCGERHRSTIFDHTSTRISIHALLAESDTKFNASTAGQSLFLSTLSLRRATPKHILQFHNWSNFYPRSPCGERPIAIPQGLTFIGISIHALLAESDSLKMQATHCFFRFLSTLSLRRATMTKRA